MLSDYPVAEVLAYLQANHARELSRAATELPTQLRTETGDNFLLPVAWAPGGALVLHFPVTFPDTLPKIFLAHGAHRPALIPHVNASGEICCFEPATVVNAGSPLAVLTSVLAKAQVVWQMPYTPDELLAEVEIELAAYWQASAVEPLFLVDDAIEHARVLRVMAERHPSERTMQRVSEPALENVLRLGVALVVDVPRDRLINLLNATKATLSSLPDLGVAFTALRAALARGTFKKRVMDVWIVCRCETTAGPVVVGLKVANRLNVDLRSGGDLKAIGMAWLNGSQISRVAVQDMRSFRLRLRTAGHQRANELANLRIALAGCGSLGGFIADGLARAGIRHWLLLDPEVLCPENLARHILNYEALYRPKATGLHDLLLRRFADLEIQAESIPAQTDSGRQLVTRFEPTLVVSATGDTNADLTLSEACRRGELGDCCFVWVEPNLAAGHLVFQPRSSAVGLHDLHEHVGGDAYYYRHRVLGDPRSLLQMEAGCQTSFTPYSGAEMQLFAYAAVKEIVTLLRQRPATLQIRRFTTAGWKTLA